jgi:hypothetical protein
VSSEAAKPGAERTGSRPARLGRGWRALPPDRRLAAGAALGLFLSLFLPWYQETGLASAGSRVQAATASLTGWAAFSWVEAAVLLVAAGVLALLFLRAEGRAFHLPGGDGGIVMVAGGWTCLLVVWRIFDKQGVTTRGQFATTSGIEWGIFITLGVAAMLAYAGSRIRAAHLPEPPLPGDERAAGAAREIENGPWPAKAGARATTSRGAQERQAKRAGSARRAPWAEPVTWDEPAASAEPAALTRVVETTDGANQLTIPFEGEPPK